MSHFAKLLERISFSWLNYVFDSISDRFGVDDAPNLPDHCLAGSEKAKKLSELLSNSNRKGLRFNIEEDDNVKAEKINIYRSLISVFGWDYLMLGLFIGFQAVFTFSGPILLHKLVDLTENGADINNIVFYIVLLVLSKITASLMNTQYSFGCGIMLVKVSSSLKTFIFNKTLRLSTSSRRKYSAGNITNLYTVDIERVVNAIIALHNIWLMPLQILLCMLLLYMQVSYAVFAGLGTVLFVLYLNHRISLLQKAANEKNMEFKDLRMKSMSEVFGSMLVVKLNAWEEKFSAKILASREEELKYVWINLINAAFSIFLLWLAPCLVSVITIVTYVKVFHGTVSASRIFTAIALFKMLQDPLRNLPNCITQLYQASTSAERIQSYCGLDEKETDFLVDCSGEEDENMQQTVRKGCIYSGQFNAFWMDLDAIDENTTSGEELSGAESNVINNLTMFITNFVDSIKNVWNKNNFSTENIKYDELSNSSEHGSVEMTTAKDKVLSSLDEDSIDNSISNSISNSSSNINECTKLFSLRVLAIQINPCDFVVIRGLVGSGKSSFLSALLGDMYIKCENSNQFPKLFGSVSYASQQPWIQNMSIRNNILFGLPYDREKYIRVVDACCLVTDFEELPQYDGTEIGEKGLNISGGQKARIALARAIYADTDIIILDDILAALDSIVGKKIFEKCILGLLSEKTRILVTHAEDIFAHNSVSQIIEVCNGIVTSNVLNNSANYINNRRAIVSVAHCNYRISTQYDPANVLSKKNNIDLASFEEQGLRSNLVSYAAKHENSSKLCGDAEVDKDVEDDSIFDSDNDLSMEIASVLKNSNSNSDENDRNNSNVVNYSQLKNEETRAHGKIDRNVYMGYINAMGGLKVLIFLGIVQSCWQVLFVEADLYLSAWSSESSATQHSELNKNISTYTMLSLGSALVVLIRTLTVSTCGFRAAKFLFEKMLNSLMHAPMSWLDKNPSGRILNRVSDDQSKVDNNMPFAVGSMFATGFSLLGALVAVIGITKYLIFILIPISYIYFKLMNKYLKVSREIQRMTQTTQSPVLSYMSECTDGLYVIRAFGSASIKYCISQNEILINTNSRIIYLSGAANSWFVLRIQLIGAIVLLFIVVFTCVHISKVSSGLVGLSISYGLSICNELQSIVMMWSWFENSMISPERIIEYIDIPVEGTEFQKKLYRRDNDCSEIVVHDSNMEINPIISKSNGSGSGSDSDRLNGIPQSIPKQWPSRGNILFNNVCFRYQPDSELVLKNLTFEVEGGSKIGIVGRTGSGKSTISLCLFRIAELTSGSIIIDGIDISAVDLFTLRSGLEIVPQNPVLFKGTLKNYLDPFNEFSLDEIISSIKKCNLMSVLKKMSNNNYNKLDNITNSNAVIDGIDSNYNGGIPASDLQSILNSEIAENGSNLSVGERQIIVLCRAILRKARFLLLDEATANVDFATDQHIQQVLRDEFQYATVLTIAHRIDTIISSDKVLVMSAGQAVEFDSPKTLLQRDSSLFSELVCQSSSMPNSPLKDDFKVSSSAKAELSVAKNV